MIRMDFETYSEADLGSCGVTYYASHPSTEVICLGYRIDDLPVQLWHPGKPPPQDLFDALASGDLAWAWNAAFERRIWSFVCHKVMGWPDVPLEQWRCSMALAASLSLPLGLDKCGRALGLSEELVKDGRGKRLISKLSKPRKPSKNNPDTRWTMETAEQDYLDFYEYCKQDVVSEQAIHEALPLQALSAREQEYWFMDQRINDRGVYVDTEAIDKILEYDDRNKIRLKNRLSELTDGELTSGDQVAKLMAWCNDHGATLDNLQRPSIDAQLLRDGLSDTVKEVLSLRLELGKKTAAKYRKMKMGVCEDNRIKDCFQYHAGHTGRAGGRRVQLQNMARPLIKDPDLAIKDILEGVELESLEFLHGAKFSDITVSCIRGMLRSAPNKEFLVADYSAIEARVTAWLAGQKDVLDVFFGHGKIYEKAAAGIYKTSIEKVTKDQRFIGKIAVLALGFGGGKGAFIGMARNYGVDISETKAQQIVKDWRNANKHIVKYWYAIEKAAINAIRCPGKVFSVKKVSFKFSKKFLWCRLPSGRLLSFPFAYVEKKMTDWGSVRYGIIYYREMDGRWCKEHTYGGRLVENIVQAAARDLLMHGMYLAYDNGFPIIVHIHDEAVTEAEENSGMLHDFEQYLCDLPDWAEGLPLDADGYVAQRYRKD